MASTAKTTWDTESKKHLDQLEELHAAAAGIAWQRSWPTDHLYQGLFVSLVAQFQAYCKALHDEAVEAMLNLVDPRLSETIKRLAIRGRRLDQQTPRPSVLGYDFGLLGISIIPAMHRHTSTASADLQRLDLLIDFRNAATHGNRSDADELASNGGIEPTLQSFRSYRTNTDRLVPILDKTVADTLASALRAPPPW